MRYLLVFIEEITSEVTQYTLEYDRQVLELGLPYQMTIRAEKIKGYQVIKENLTLDPRLKTDRDKDIARAVYMMARLELAAREGAKVEYTLNLTSKIPSKKDFLKDQ